MPLPPAVRRRSRHCVPPRASAAVVASARREQTRPDDEGREAPGAHAEQPAPASGRCPVVAALAGGARMRIGSSATEVSFDECTGRLDGHDDHSAGSASTTVGLVASEDLHPIRSPNEHHTSAPGIQAGRIVAGLPARASPSPDVVITTYWITIAEVGDAGKRARDGVDRLIGHVQLERDRLGPHGGETAGCRALRRRPARTAITVNPSPRELVAVALRRCRRRKFCWPMKPATNADAGWS